MTATDAYEIATAYMGAYERAYAQGAAAAARLYCEDGMLVGQGVAEGRSRIEALLDGLIGRGYARIAITVRHARRVGGVVLAVCEYAAAGTGASAGMSVTGKSTHVLTQVGGEWLNAMHSAA